MPHVTSLWLLITPAAAVASSMQAQVHLVPTESSLRDIRVFASAPWKHTQHKPLQKNQRYWGHPSTSGDPASHPPTGQFWEVFPTLLRRSFIKDPYNDFSYSSHHLIPNIKDPPTGISLVAQRLRIRLPMQGARV